MRASIAQIAGFFYVRTAQGIQPPPLFSTDGQEPGTGEKWELQTVLLLTGMTPSLQVP
jgi:hypothetical protein